MGQILLESLTYVMMWVPGLPKTLGNTQLSANRQLLTHVQEGIHYNSFLGHPFCKIK